MIFRSEECCDCHGTDVREDEPDQPCQLCKGKGTRLVARPRGRAQRSLLFAAALLGAMAEAEKED